MYTGEVKQAASGQWAWCVCEDGVAIVSGAGYDTEKEAEADMADELAEYQGRLPDGNTRRTDGSA